MKLENLKKDIPETPDFIHEMIQNEVNHQIHSQKVVNLKTRRSKKWSMGRIAGIAAVCVLATSTLVYAGVSLFHMYLEKTGEYSVATGVESEQGTDPLKIPDKLHGIDIKTGYVPEGMEWTDDRHLEYPEHNETGGFSFSSVLFDENDLNAVMQDTYVVNSEKRNFGKYEGVYLEYQNLTKTGSFNKRIYLLCPEYYRVVTVYIGSDVSKEDAIKVVDSLEITENDMLMEATDMYRWSEVVSP
ncbi:MAG: DUF4367 domain-containing protein [Eubacteriales bacterium]|nr:DUF4367 domain-containing protein [Eubacteriales bacterium]